MPARHRFAMIIAACRAAFMILCCNAGESLKFSAGCEARNLLAIGTAAITGRVTKRNVLWIAVYAAGPAVLHQSDLQRLIRLQASEVLGCTRLLNADGQIGCSGSWNLTAHHARLNVAVTDQAFLAVDKTEAVLLALDDPDQPLSNAATVVLSALHLDAFLLNTKSNATLQQLVKGVLVDLTGV